MMKLQVQNLADAFGWMNLRARDFADTLGNRIASRFNVGLVMQAAGKINSMRGAFEIAANAWRMVATPESTGRAFKPFLLSREPR